MRPEVLLAAGQVDLRTDLFDCQMYVLSRQALRILEAHPNMASLKVCSPIPNPCPCPQCFANVLYRQLLRYSAWIRLATAGTYHLTFLSQALGACC